MTLKGELIQVMQDWPELTKSKDGSYPQCPLSYTEEEVSECLQLDCLQEEVDQQVMTVCEKVIGIGPDGWVPLDHYEGTMERSKKLRADAVEGAESELELTRINEHWPFDDQDEQWL